MSYENKSRIILPLVFLLLLVGVLFLLSQNLRNQEIIEGAFVETRDSLATGGMNAYRQGVQKEFKDLFMDCRDRALYDSYVDSDSRYMSTEELENALQLHPFCSHYFTAQEELVVREMERDIERLKYLASLFTGIEEAKNASVVVSLWDDIYALEVERVSIEKRFHAIQESYWQHDLDKITERISSEEREAGVGALNYEANEGLSRVEEIKDELSDLRTREIVFWSESFTQD